MEILTITSRDNARLADARAVRDGKDRSRIFVEGKRLVEEALRSRVEIVECFVSTELDDVGIVEKLKETRAKVSYVDAKLFRSIADTENSQGLIVIAKRPIVQGALFDKNPVAIPIHRDSDKSLPVVLYLHEINNPSNLGAVFRTAEAAGITTVIVSENSTDAFSPKALRASMGSAFRLKTVEGVEFSNVVDGARQNGLIVTAADTSAERSHHEIDWSVPRLLIIGSEAHGLSDVQLSLADELVRIEMSNDVESLNLAVSAGIILFEAKRQTVARP